MAISGLGQNFYYNNRAAVEKRTVSDRESDFEASIQKASSNGTNRFTLDPDALFSICHAKTGESANVYRAEGYSEEQPLYRVKGIDKNGQEYEEIIDVSKVNPSNCSYREMLALNAHTGDKSDRNFLTMSILKDKTEGISYEEKADYLSKAYDLMAEMKSMGYWDGYLRYDKWIKDITSVSESKMTTWKNGKPLQENTASDPRYTDKETGISWYVRDGKAPYMTGEDVEKLKELCRRTGEPWLKKFAEITGTIQHIDENTTAFIGDNGTVIKSKDGKELQIDTSSMTYDELMNMFRNVSKTGNYFDSGFWAANMRRAQQNGGNHESAKETAARSAWESRIGNNPFNPYGSHAVSSPSRAAMERAGGARRYTVYMMGDDMIYSGGNGSGLSFYIKYAEGSTEEDPTVIAKGVDENGMEFEQIIHINKINPRNATLVEMRALEAHLGVNKNGGLSSLPMHPSIGDMGLHDRADFIDWFEQQIKDMKLLGQKRLADYYAYSMRMYSDFMLGNISGSGRNKDWRR